MSKIDVNKALAFVKNKWVNGCSICDSKTHWNISPNVFELREFQGGSFVIGGNTPIIPLVHVTCTNCGNTVLLNAKITGAMAD